MDGHIDLWDVRRRLCAYTTHTPNATAPVLHALSVDRPLQLGSASGDVYSTLPSAVYLADGAGTVCLAEVK